MSCRQLVDHEKLLSVAHPRLCLCPQEKDEIARAIYDDFSSPQEELRHLMRMVKRSIQQRYTEDSTPVEVAAMAGAGAGEGNGASAATRAMASVRAIQNELMINADGSMAPLTLRQRRAAAHH